LHIGVVIPTFNEAENLPRLVSVLLALPLELSILIVDDNSPDGTGTIADQLAAAEPGRLGVLHSPEKLGVASAYKVGIRSILEKDVDAVAQMDGDCSHDPADLVAMVKQLESFDLVLGSRFINGASVDPHWPFWRKTLSRWGNFYARTILSMPYEDLTTGYRLWRRPALAGIPFDRIYSNGYVFEVETAYLAYRLQYHISEVPIHFTERTRGESKMSFKIQVEAAWRIWQMLFAYDGIRRPDPTVSIKTD